MCLHFDFASILLLRPFCCCILLCRYSAGLANSDPATHDAQVVSLKPDALDDEILLQLSHSTGSGPLQQTKIVGETRIRVYEVNDFVKNAVRGGVGELAEDADGGTMEIVEEVSSHNAMSHMLHSSHPAVT